MHSSTSARVTAIARICGCIQLRLKATKPTTTNFVPSEAATSLKKFKEINSSKSQKNSTIAAKISLANKWKASVDPTGMIMSEKLDGMRAYWDGKQLWSRTGLPVIFPDWFVAQWPKELELDGELFMDRKQFSECMSITRRHDGQGDWAKLKFVVFDAPTVPGGIQERLTAAKATLALQLPDNEHTVVVHPHAVCTGIDHLLDTLTAVEALGGEGLMLRSATAAHKGGRSSDLLKVKSFVDDEALVTDHEPGKGRHEGVVGALVCVNRSGARFKVGSGLTDNQRLFSQAPPVGSVITFKYFELSNDGNPRFPTFLRLRPDVDASEFTTQSG